MTRKMTKAQAELGERLLEFIYDEVDRSLNPGGEECWYCGGEGETYYCFDGCCEDAASGCLDCARPCPECRILKGLRAKAVRLKVIESGDVAVAVAWLKSIGRWNDDITLDRVEKELTAGRAALSEAGHE